jgi:hypothetical protein
MSQGEEPFEFHLTPERSIISSLCRQSNGALDGALGNREVNEFLATGFRFPTSKAKIRRLTAVAGFSNS